MCGICGFLTKKDISLKQLEAMNDTMYHRGPDDGGAEVFAFGGYRMGLAQRRLAIMDLSALGHQPMHTPDRNVSVVFNGEIYNFRQLREELSGYPFVSDCDTEVILAAYVKWGISCVERFNGMFAIAIADRAQERFFLVRDRIGKKPLYYWAQEGQLVFASELKPLMACPGFGKHIRRDVLPRYLFQQYIQAPDTIFEHVYKLEPGTVLEWQAGQISTRKYWDIYGVYCRMAQEPVKEYGQAREELKRLLQEAVASRMVADVPLGAFLSGGYDSSLMTALAQEQSAQPVKTFSIGFSDKNYDEAQYARQVASALGTDHTELYIGEQEMFELVESLPYYFDEPFADSSQIPTMLVSSLARRDVTVALSGDGGDEFFCGYNLYKKVAQAQLLDVPGGLVHGLCGLPVLRRAGLEERLPFPVRVIAQNQNRETKTQFGENNYTLRAKRMAAQKEGNLPCHYEQESRYRVGNWQVRRMLLDMDTYLPGDILCKVDRASMKYSLEARCPILDTQVMEYSFRIPHRFKYHKGDKKHILKDIAYEYVPRQLLDRPKKGFSVPLDAWLRGPLRQRLLSYSDVSFLKRQGLFDAGYVSQMIRDWLAAGDRGQGSGENYSKLSWSFFVFQQWYEQMMER